MSPKHPGGFINLTTFGSEKPLPAWMRNPTWGHHIHSNSQKTWISDGWTRHPQSLAGIWCVPPHPAHPSEEHHTINSWFQEPLPAPSSSQRDKGSQAGAGHILQIFSLPCSERRVKILTGIILIIIKPPWLYTDSFPWEIVRKRGMEGFWLWNESTTGWHYVFWSWLASKLGVLTNIFSHKNHKRVGKKMFDSLLGKLKICHLFSALQPLKNASAGRKRGWLVLGCSCWRDLREQPRKGGRGAAPSLPIPALPG